MLTLDGGRPSASSPDRSLSISGSPFSARRFWSAELVKPHPRRRIGIWIIVSRLSNTSSRPSSAHGVPSSRRLRAHHVVDEHRQAGVAAILDAMPEVRADLDRFSAWSPRILRRDLDRAPVRLESGSDAWFFFLIEAHALIGASRATSVLMLRRRSSPARARGAGVLGHEPHAKPGMVPG